MPKKPASEIKKPIYIRLSPESLSYVKRLAETTRRDLTNVIEYLIYLHSSKQLPEPIPYFNKEPKKLTDKKPSPKADTPKAHDSVAQESQNPNPDSPQQETPIEIMRNPYADKN